MKKKLEADLISIAHRILQIKNKSDVNQLLNETQKLYEKLAVLRFVEEHFSDAKPSIGQAEVVEKMKEFFDTISLPQFQTPSPVNIASIKDEAQQQHITSPEKEVHLVEDAVEEELPAQEETTIEPLAAVPSPSQTEINAEELIEKPLFALDQPQTESTKKKEIVQISFDDLLGGHYTDPDFVKVSATAESSLTEAPSLVETSDPSQDNIEAKAISLNDKLAKEINIGLNDRIAFVKHLFGGNNEDYNRVISQLITFDNYPETKIFIDEMVKPDYNNWEGKEEYEQRFIEIIEKKFLTF